MEGNHTVFVIDGDPNSLRSTLSLLESNGLKVETYRTGVEFLDDYDPDTPGCLVLDVHIPGMSGLVLQERLVATGRRPSIIFMTWKGDVPTCVRAMKLGAFDFLEKPVNDQKFVRSVREAVDQDVKRCRLERQQRETKLRLDRLSAREREVMSRLIKGEPAKGIAAELGITQKTALKHRARVLRKLEVKSEAELVRHYVHGRFSSSHR